MQKLIVEFQIGDIYTYCATETLPAVFSSKEEFIITFEDTILKVINEIKDLNQKQKECSKLQKELLMRAQKGNGTKEEKLKKELVECQIKLGDLYTKIEKFSTFRVGQQLFEVSCFYENDVLTIPRVYTVDEYFSEKLASH